MEIWRVVGEKGNELEKEVGGAEDLEWRSGE